MADLKGVISRGVNSLGLELVDVQWSPRSGLLQVFIEHPPQEGRIVSVEDCARTSRQLELLLVTEGVNYRNLEVSSPGLDRPLKTLGDFQRFCGSIVKIRLRAPRDGRRNFSGVLIKVQEQNLWVQSEEGAWTFPLAEVESARLDPQI